MRAGPNRRSTFASESGRERALPALAPYAASSYSRRVVTGIPIRGSRRGGKMRKH
jgi:hypothetical protein